MRDPRVIDAMRRVPREAFLDEDRQPEAYEDRPQWIGLGQTMSAPHMVAIMCEALGLEPGQRVLEIGTGSGYHAAVVAAVIGPEGRLTSVELVPELAERARDRLARAGVPHVRVVVGDGGGGWPPDAPYDRIYLTCSAARFPPPLFEQAAPDGWILAPLGDLPSRLVRARRLEGRWTEEELGACAFVPLRGRFGLA